MVPSHYARYLTYFKVPKALKLRERVPAMANPPPPQKLADFISVIFKLGHRHCHRHSRANARLACGGKTKTISVPKGVN